MKTGFMKILILATILVATTACACQGQQVDPRTMTFPTLKFNVPQSERFQLANGMIVYLMTNHELPLVNITAYVNTGNIYESPDKTGLAGLTGAVMRSGGTSQTPPEKLDAELEFMASAVETGIGNDVGNVSLSTLTKNLDRTLDLYGQVIMSPAFREDRLELARKRTIEGIRRQNDDPKGIADREFYRALYAGHPLGRVPTIETVKAISREDMVEFHRNYFRPNNIILAVSGDIDRADLRTKLEKVFGSWAKGEVRFPQVPPPRTDIAPEVLLAKKDVNQTVIRMGHLGIDKNNPDLYAIRVMDYILGGGFTSRLTTEIRSNQGLAYNVDSNFDVGRRFIGTFRAETETKSATTIKAINLMRTIIEGMTQAPVTDQELNLAKDSIINSFIFGFAKPESVVNQQVRLEYYGYKPGYLENYRDNIAKVTKDDVLRVAKKYLNPQQMIIVVVGDERKFDQPLATLGTVREIKLETPK